jgi:Putative Ig domain
MFTGAAPPLTVNSLRLGMLTICSDQIPAAILTVLTVGALTIWTGCSGISTASSSIGNKAVPLAIDTDSLPTAMSGTAYSTNLSGRGGQPPYQWTIAHGTLPSGLQLNHSTGVLNGTPTAEGQFPFEIGLSDRNRSSVQQNLTLRVTSAAACAPPTYSCARTDTNVTALPGTLPNWGGLIGANTRFVDQYYNPNYAVAYTRVTDAKTGSVLGVTNIGFAVGSGSGDDAHFNADESLFTLTDENAAWYFFGLNRSTMQTGLVFASDATSNIIWSQTNRNYAYELSNVGSGLYRLDFTGCYLGGPTCSPPVTLFYDFANCGVPTEHGFFVNGGIGGNDNMYAGAIGTQDIDNRIFVYDAEASTCYLYNTRFGIIRSATGTQSAITGTGSCNGTDGTFTWLSGATFGTGSDTWAGASIMLGSKTYQVASVSSSTSLSLGYTCPSGTYSFSITPGAYVGAIPSGDQYSVHDIRLDPAGVWLVIEQGTECYAGSCNLVHAWQIGTTTVNSCPWTYDGSDPGSCGSHYTETASGWINADGNFANSTSPSMQFRTWANFSTTDGALVTELSTVNYTFSVPFDNHPTAKNDPLGLHSYPVFSSTYTPEASVGAISNAYSNEVMAWTQSPGLAGRHLQSSVVNFVRA